MAKKSDFHMQFFAKVQKICWAIGPERILVKKKLGQPGFGLNLKVCRKWLKVKKTRPTRYSGRFWVGLDKECYFHS